MNKTLKFAAASTLAAGLLLAATPAFADTNRDNAGAHLGGFFNLPLVHVGIGAYKNDYKVASTTGTTTPVMKPMSKTIEVGTVSSVNGATITLSPAIAFGATTSASTNVVTNSSTKFKGASSTANLTSGENVLIVGTTSTSSPGTITASIVVALQNVGRFFWHLFR